MSGSAGSMMSIDIAVIDINSAISAMNSRNGSGKRVTASSDVWVSDWFKGAYVQKSRGASASPCSGPAIPCVR